MIEKHFLLMIISHRYYILSGEQNYLNQYEEQRKYLQKYISKINYLNEKLYIALIDMINEKIIFLNSMIELRNNLQNAPEKEIIKQFNKNNYNNIFDIITTIENKMLLNISNIEIAIQKFNNLTKYSIIILVAFFLLYLIFIVIFIIVRNLHLKYDLLELQKNELEKINTLKNRFFTIISHDLRNPFNSILGFINLFTSETEKCGNTICKEYANIIEQSANQYFSLLEDLLKWSNIQLQNIIVHIEQINIDIIVQEVLNIYKLEIQNKELKINVINHNIDFVRADKNILYTILRNIINNAIKFSKRSGLIEIQIENPNGKKCLIKIKDNGIGMDQDICSNLFKPDGKTKRSGTNGEMGSGLGLIICQELIKTMNGNISVQSVINKGSIFSIELFEQVL